MLVHHYLGYDLAPRQQGTLDAHKIGAGPTSQVERCLKKARRQRRALLTWILPGRRHFLEGLIDGLEEEMRMRGRDSARH